MNWEATVLLPLLSLLCAGYIYVLFLRSPEAPGGTNLHNKVVIPPDSQQSFDQILARLRTGNGDWAAAPENGPLYAQDDDFFLDVKDPQPRGPPSYETRFQELEPSTEYECRSGFVTFKSEVSSKYLWAHAVEHDGWLSAAASVHTPVCLRAFEVTPVGGDCTEGGGYVALKAVDTGRIVRGAGRDEDTAWVVRTEDAGEVSTAHHFLLEKEGFIYHKNAKAVVNVVPGDYSPIRLHASYAATPQPAQREYSAQFQVEWLRSDEIEKCRKQLEDETAKDEEQDKQLIERISKLPKSNEQRYVSFGLYGANPKYTTGAIRNAELAPVYFPGWKLRYYVRDDVPKSVIDKLSSFPHVEVVIGQKDINGAAAGMFWRFTIADDPNVDRFIVRDVDSRLNARDRLAVEEWIESGLGVHVIRDHVNHCIAMNGGMWGAKHGAVKNIRQKIQDWYDTHSYGADLQFLQAMVWSQVEDNQLSHDSYCCLRFPNAKGFPTKRPYNYQHVGQVFDENDQPRISDIEGFIRGVETPAQCRRKPKWQFG